CHVLHHHAFPTRRSSDLNDERVSFKTVHIRLTEYSVRWSSTNLEADHQRVWSAKYFAALGKMFRSSRSLAFSLSNARIRSSSDTYSAWALASAMRVFFPVPNSFFH